MDSRTFTALSRRGFLYLAPILSINAASSKHFWEAEPATSWTADQIQELLTKSPWAKEVLVQYREAMDSSRPQMNPTSPGRGEAAVGECGIVNCVNVMPGKAFVTWESAAPIREALRSPLPPEFEDRYVIGIRGLQGGYSTQQLKIATELSGKGKAPLQPGVIGLRGTTWLFGFSRELFDITPRDSELQFVIHAGPELTQTLLRTSFNPKEMLYRGELAI